MERMPPFLSMGMTSNLSCACLLMLVTIGRVYIAEVLSYFAVLLCTKLILIIVGSL